METKLINLEIELDSNSATHERFALVWTKHRQSIWRLTARIAGNADTADDLTQETCVRAFKAFAGFRGRSDALTWLYRIAIHVSLRYLQVERERTRSLVSIRPDTADESGRNAFERADSNAELLPAVRAALATLPEEIRLPLILKVYQELTYREIAEALEIPIGTVMSRLHSARKRLREELKDYAL